MAARSSGRCDETARAKPGLAVHNRFPSPTIENQGSACNSPSRPPARPVVVLDDPSPAKRDPASEVAAPDGAVTSFSAIVRERACTGGKMMGGRLLPPSITYGTNVMLVVFATPPLETEVADRQMNRPTRVVVQMIEPVGDRALLDASMFRPWSPTA